LSREVPAGWRRKRIILLLFTHHHHLLLRLFLTWRLLQLILDVRVAAREETHLLGPVLSASVADRRMRRAEEWRKAVVTALRGQRHHVHQKCVIWVTADDNHDRCFMPKVAIPLHSITSGVMPLDLLVTRCSLRLGGNSKMKEQGNTEDETQSVDNATQIIAWHCA
jgi:hypothetical protein